MKRYINDYTQSRGPTPVRPDRPDVPERVWRLVTVLCDNMIARRTLYTFYWEAEISVLVQEDGVKALPV